MTDDFYSKQMGQSLRFGDVIDGTPCITLRLGEDHASSSAWSITVTSFRRLVVLTPCCNIERKEICLAPLEHLRPAFLKNSYLSEDLTRINRMIPPERSLPDGIWETLKPEEQARRADMGAQYVFLECFIYAPNEILSPYPLQGKNGNSEMRHYMIDIKKAFRVEWPVIERQKPLPSGLKLLELSLVARAMLREKMSYYYGRVPEEDMAIQL